MAKVFFSTLTLLLSAWWLKRCKQANSDKPKPIPTQEKSQETINETPTPKPSQNTGQQTAPSTSESSCLKTDSLPLDLIPKAPENLHIKYQLLGSKSSALLGFTIPKYLHEATPINAIYICNESGLILAQRGFSAFNDLSQTQTFIPIAIEHLDLSQCNSLVFVMVLDTQKSYQYTSENQLEFTTTFNGKPVTNAIDSSSIIFATDFIPIKNKFIISPDMRSVKPDDVRQIESFSSFRESIIVDVAGQVISPLGEEFFDIFSYPLFIRYIPKSNYYIRTIFWVC